MGPVAFSFYDIRVDPGDEILFEDSVPLEILFFGRYLKDLSDEAKRNQALAVPYGS